MVRQIIDNEDGYTVTEVLVALTLLTIISTIVGSVFIFTARQMNNWRESVQTINETHIISERLYRDALLSNRISVTDTNMVFSLPLKGNIQYSKMDRDLMRNGVQLTEYADSLYLDELHIDSEISRFGLKFVHKGSVNHSRVVVGNRKPRLWEAVIR